ncbi:MAG: AraC family transcriptional regulator [Flavobacteriaceae bacterium]|nr:MAG: AraC family transcriptional regulator [Flavobacteriaceae bacterium]
MEFPDYFIDYPKFRTIEGTYGMCIEYFHKLDSITDIQLNINELFCVYVIEGVIKFQSPGDTVWVYKDNLAVVNKGPYIMSESLSVNNNFKAYIVFLKRELLEEYYSKNVYAADHSLSHSNVKDILIIENCLLIKSFAESISLLYRGNYESRKKTDLIDIKTKELIHYLSYSNLSKDIYRMMHPVIGNDFKFRKTINNNYLNSLDLKDLAFLCDMSLSSFKRKFSEIYNTTPSKWIKNKKLEHSLKLIEGEKFSIKEIAYKCGFENATTFSRLFKSKYGASPKYYMQ